MNAKERRKLRRKYKERLAVAVVSHRMDGIMLASAPGHMIEDHGALQIQRFDNKLLPIVGGYIYAQDEL